MRNLPPLVIIFIFYFFVGDQILPIFGVEEFIRNCGPNTRTMFTVLFALARTVGWVAQWNEMIEDPQQKIGRPRQLYTGEPQRSFVPLADRG